MPQQTPCSAGCGGDRFALVMRGGCRRDARCAIAEAARDACRARDLGQSGYPAQRQRRLGDCAARWHDARRAHAPRRLGAARRPSSRGRGWWWPLLAANGSGFRRAAASSSASLRARSRRGRFDVHYQPIVKADGGAIVGVEALLRWNHPSRGDIPPACSCAVAEEAGLMDQLGEFVLRRALADAARWPHLYVAVNLVAGAGARPQVRRSRRAVLDETKIAPSRVVLEITEKRPDRRSRDRQGAARGSARARREAGARRFRLRLFEP